MNELIFLLQILLIVCFSFGAFKLGKEALIAWVSIQAIIANLFVLKQIKLFGFDVTASDSYMIGSLLGLNLLQEHFSQEDANKATRICFFCMSFFAIISQVHLLFLPNLHDVTQQAYHILLSPSLRLLAASMGVFIIVQTFDIRFFVLIRTYLPHINFAWRAAIALFFSQFLDTILFSFLGLYGMVASIIDIIFISFLIKLIATFSITLCIRGIMRWT